MEKIALTEAVYYILISLHQPMHGYGIMQNISEITNERLNIGAGTLYGAINTLIDKKWIVPYEQDNNSRKKEYIITDLGKSIVKNELLRLEELVENGKKTIEGDLK